MNQSEIEKKAREFDAELEALRNLRAKSLESYRILDKEYQQKKKALEGLWEKSIQPKSFKSTSEVADHLFENIGIEYFEKTRDRILKGGWDDYSIIKYAIIYLFWYYNRDKRSVLRKRLQSYFNVKNSFDHSSISHSINRGIKGEIILPDGTDIRDFVKMHKVIYSNN